MGSTCIIAEDLGKRYRLGEFGITSFRDELIQTFSKLKRQRAIETPGSSSNPDFWALKDISFKIEEGDTVGLIGRNGAGKSTLLKLLARITAPSTGRVKMHGKVAALLEVGTGFHPDLSGIENIYLNGAILGMRRWEIRSKLDSILEFSGVEKFANTPVKRYSSGMRVRLAFAVAAHLRQDILIVDEVLAVGDYEFQKKCLGKMGEVSRDGRTVVFVSHNMFAVSRLCKKCMYLKQGQLEAQGPTGEIIPLYLSDTKGNGGVIEWENGFSDPGVTDFRLKAVKFISHTGSIDNKFSVLDPIRIQIHFDSDEPIMHFRLQISIRSLDGITIVGVVNDSDPKCLKIMDKGSYIYTVTIPAKRINFGNYSLSVSASIRGIRFLARADDILDFDVELLTRDSSKEEIISGEGIVYPEVFWNLESKIP